MDPTSCSKLLEAIPAAFKSQITGFELVGNTSFAANVAWIGSSLENVNVALTNSQFDCKVIKAPEDFSSVLAFTDSNISEESEVSEIGQPEEAGKYRGSYVPFSAISPKFFAAIVASEDSGFYLHKGFELQSIMNAFKRNLKEGTVVLGGSTITMQMVKNLFLSKERTIARKLQEVALSWYMETILSKNKIIEIYSNIIEYGPGIYGIHKASKYYFGKTADQLTAIESAYLAALLPNPKERFVYYCNNKITTNFRSILNKNLQKMNDLNLITSDELNSALTAKIIFNRPNSLSGREDCRSDVAINKDTWHHENFGRIEF
jgi:monofunctional biosynthetic peptidoglycan transglycosylase